MRIAAISHSCVVAVNQQLFVALSRIPGVEAVQLLVPANWRNEYTGADQAPTRLPDVDFPLLQRPVAKPGHVSLHAYRSLPLREWKAFRPDVLYAAQEPWSLANLQAIWLSRKLGAPLVFHTNQNILKRYPLPFSLFEQFAYRNAGAALAYSEDARQVMVTKGLKNPSAVVPYAVELSQFFPREAGDSSEAMVLRRSLGIADSDFVVGYLGRFVPDKGLETLVRAAATIVAGAASGDPPLKVLMVGAGPQEAELRGQIAALDLAEHFVWTGLVAHEKAGDYLRCMEAFALPSVTMPHWKEQFGRVLIEAMACGIPVIGSNSGQIPHLIAGTGGGLVFPEKDSDALAANLNTLIRDPAKRRALGETGRRASEAQYRTEAVAEQLYQVFADVVRRSGGIVPPVPRIPLTPPGVNEAV